jgi:hypothetical protein
MEKLDAGAWAEVLKLSIAVRKDRKQKNPFDLPTGKDLSSRQDKSFSQKDESQ